MAALDDDDDDDDDEGEEDEEEREESERSGEKGGSFGGGGSKLARWDEEKETESRAIWEIETGWTTGGGHLAPTYFYHH